MVLADGRGEEGCSGEEMAMVLVGETSIDEKYSLRQTVGGTESVEDWKSSCLAQFSDFLGMPTTGCEEEILNMLKRWIMRKDQKNQRIGAKRAKVETSKSVRELKRLECSINFKSSGHGRALFRESGGGIWPCCWEVEGGFLGGIGDNQGIVAGPVRIGKVISVGQFKVFYRELFLTTAPILLDCGGTRKGPSPFRFENMWLKEEGFRDLLRNWWVGFNFRGSFSFTLSEKLKALKACLKVWNREVFGNVNARKESALKQMMLWDAIEGDRVLNTEEQNSRKKALEEYEKWVIMEETAWRQKSRELWLREGDKNTGYFHKMANAHRRAFHSLLSETAEWRPRCNGLQVGVLEGENATMLEAPFSEEELEFFEGEVMGFFKEFHDQGKFVKSINASFLVLIPKKGGAEDLKDFRPISLVGSLYKLLAKVLANRLKKVMGKLVSKSQNAFVEGRQILDASLIANEAIHSMQNSGGGGILCKLDIEKAYDHVNWSFLFWLMEMMGFGAKWISWIQWCIGLSASLF
ncbi:Transposon TX1 uncharacterized 149 kDa protein [Vitis vinifera]|uniref:Transposon TX1 uncharacterized 149 kDa protein n=1 Tax=Vitis vinifera TaxID=29760 RepID=A0A438IHX6_VITVI|nr:Transposon TX1 uncharacterized 149 kDa protein [Vitis vinifera]